MILLFLQTPGQAKYPLLVKLPKMPGKNQLIEKIHQQSLQINQLIFHILTFEAPALYFREEKLKI